ncbi:D-amino-acid dehydrogenase [Planctomicrobium piriforme]|uniref:D-amino-acid dehydrogenase n=1 Tax=Planctomicrobium piriforme TaxID=1576369 RepID=A0A1I3IIB9_9PLAN|nr:D-amino-acid dehydrogenase [Planctomicrobium piriforme]
MVVVGGGVVGAACAHYLAVAGAPVLLIDKGDFGQGCSHGNCGYVSPSHILPLCRPGAVSSALRTFFRRNSPFQMRFRLDPAFWSWMWQFARRCNQIDMLQAGHARHSLLQSSRQLFDELLSEKVLEDIDWEAKGLLFVHQTRSHFEHYGETNELLTKEFGVGATPIREAELLEMEPALKPGVAGAWLYDCDAHLRSDKLMEAWQKRLVHDGVSIRENCELISLEEGDGAISAVNTTAGRIEVDQVVVATGAWTRLLSRQLRARIPIEPGKGYSITMRRPALCPTYPMIFEEHRVAVTPFASGYRIGSTMEFAGFDPTLRRDRLSLLTDAAAKYLHEPMAEPVLESWYGWRPMSCDGVPLIGRVPSFRNAWMAAGHSMLGVSMSTGTGKLISELVTGKHPHIDPHPYRVDRF